MWTRVLRSVHTGVDSSAKDKVQMSSVQEEGGFERVDEIDIRRLIVERSKKRSERNTQYIQYILHARTTTTLYKEFKEYYEEEGEKNRSREFR